jgi:formate C-acetyltransferase
MNERIALMKKSIDTLNDTSIRTTLFYQLAYDSLINTCKEPVQIRRAKAEAHILDNAPLPVLPYELIAGTMTGICPALDIVPSYETQKAKGIQVLDDYIAKKAGAGEKDENERNSLKTFEAVLTTQKTRWALMDRVNHDTNISYRDLQKLIAEMKDLYKNRDIEPFEIGRELERCFKINYGPGIKEEVDSVPWFAANHLHLNYGRMLRTGFAALIEEIGARASAAEDDSRKEYYRAALIAAGAASRFMKRYASSIRNAANGEVEPRKSELSEMADICEGLAAAPAATFREAVQFSWLLQIMMSMVWGSALSLGRFDQYMRGYYEKDIASGAITRETAKELLCCLWLKVNEPKLRTVQSLTLGGITDDGEDAANSLTELCLEVVRDMKLPYPNVGVRLNRKNPEWLYDKVVDSIKAGGGQPMMMNDDVFIENLMKLGYAEKYANDYYHMGCVEIMIPGKQPNWFPTEAISFPMMFERVFKKYRAGGLTLNTFAAFRGAYDKELVEAVMADKREADGRMKSLPGRSYDPLASLMVDGCLENGRDMFQGGAELGIHWAIYAYGLGTAADSMVAIKKFVYDEKRLSIGQLAGILEKNFEGTENIRLLLDSRTPHYGNDNDEADMLAKDILSVLDDTVMAFNSKDNPNKYVATLFGYFCHVYHGEVTGATANGRRKGEAFSDSMGPSQGKDANGPASMLNSVLKLDHGGVTGGYALNLKVNPDLVRTENGTKAMKSLIKSYFADKGPQLQIYFVDAETLKAAKAEPERHKNVIVRVGGYCEYFVNLDAALQDEIILRTIHSIG